jgi:hypothetical protein
MQQRRGECDWPDAKISKNLCDSKRMGDVRLATFAILITVSVLSCQKSAIDNR